MSHPRTATSFLAALLVACTPRGASHASDPPPIADADLDAAFLQATNALRFEPLDVERRDDHVSPVVPSLAALATAESWGAVGPCQDDTCDGLVEHARVPFTGPPPPAPTHRTQGPPIEELRVVATTRSPLCVWRLVARTRSGWLPSRLLGESAAGCTRPFDANALEPDVVPFFPLAITSTSDALRIEGQGVGPDPDDWERRRLRRVVTLCRKNPLGPDTVACASEDAATAGMPEPTLNAPRLTADPSFLPLAAAARVGTDLPAAWFVAPPPSPHADVLRPLTYWHEVRAREAPLTDDARVLVIATDGMIRVLLLRPSGALALASHYADFDNDTLALEHVTAAPGVVRVALSLTSDGPTRVSWHWEELITPRRQLRLATGVALAADGAPLGAWRRAITADADGVTLAAAEGSLAWFRGTGHFTWDALAARLPHWQRAFAKAWQVHRQPPAGRDIDELGKDHITRLALVPGTLEPLHRPVVDLARAIP